MLKFKIISALLLLYLLAGCELMQVPQATPTVAVPPSETATSAPSQTPSPTLTLAAQLASSTPTVTPGPPTDTPTQTPTPNPYATYVIQPGDTLIYIIQQPPFYYRTLTDAMVNEIFQLNPGMQQDINRLPGPGSSITLPLPPATPTPQGADLTATSQSGLPQQSVPSNAQIIQVTVQDGDTIVGIAQSNSTTLRIIATLNPDLDFGGCDFTNASGGPDCNVPLRIGQKINVPALTPTPTLSPTISGSETATPTPTYAAPSLVFPPDDGQVTARTFQLEWLSAGVLRDKEVYLIEIQDVTSGKQKNDITTATSYDLPASLVPTDGKTHTIQWRVSVAAPNDQGVYAYIGATGNWRTFHWQSK